MGAKGSSQREADIIKLFYECKGFNGYTMRTKDPKYGDALERYLSLRKILVDQMDEDQIRLLFLCIEALQLCTGFEYRYYFRQGFLKGYARGRKA